jgi:hypothetical protein
VSSESEPEARHEIEPREDLEPNLERLRALSKEAEGGDRRSQARAELRRALARSSPEVIAEASSVARRAEWMLVKTISAGDTLMQEALQVRTEHMRAEIGGENPTPLELLLTERVVAGWLLVEVLEALIAGQYRVGRKESRVRPDYIIQQSRILESATRRYLAAVRELARVRKLQAGTPVRVNTPNIPADSL